MVIALKSILLGLMLLCMAILSLAASATVRQWGETAGFSDFGISSPTILLSAQDTLDVSMPMDIGNGDFVYAAHATASPTRPWGITMSGKTVQGTEISVSILTSCTETTSTFDEAKLSGSIIITHTIDGKTVTTSIPRKEKLLKRYAPTGSIVVERHDRAWTVTLRTDNSKSETYPLTIENPDMAVERLGLTVPSGRAPQKGGFGKKTAWVEIHRATVHYTPTPPMSPYTSVDSLKAIFEQTTDPIEGFYRISERSFDEQYLRAGNDYLLALVRTHDGGYDIIYISGATMFPESWQTGMVHGNARPTATRGQYKLTWTDVQFRPIDSEGQMTTDGEGLVIFQFPYLFSTANLQRLNPRTVTK